MYEDEFDELLHDDEADTLVPRRVIRTRLRPPFYRRERWTKAQRDEFNRERAARQKEIAACVEPVDGRCPEGYHLDWALHPLLRPGIVGMPAPRKVCHPDKPGTPPEPTPDPMCGTRSEGKGITWGRILPQYRRLSRTERQAVLDKICGRKPKPKPVIPDEAARKELTDKYNAAKSKYELLMVEKKTIIDKLKQKNAAIAAARKVVVDAQRQLGMLRRLPEFRHYRILRRR